MTVRFETRMKFIEEVKAFAKLLAMGGKANYNLNDIKNRYYKLYMEDIKRFSAPSTTKRKIVKELIEEDLKFAINEVQREG